MIVSQLSSRQYLEKKPIVFSARCFFRFVSTFRDRHITADAFIPKEFVDARRLPTIQNAPQVLYSSKDPPLEIRDVKGLAHGDDIGYVTFGTFTGP